MNIDDADVWGIVSTTELHGAKGPIGERVYRSILSNGQVAYHNESLISVHPCDITYPQSSDDCLPGQINVKGVCK